MCVHKERDNVLCARVAIQHSTPAVILWKPCPSAGTIYVLITRVLYVCPTATVGEREERGERTALLRGTVVQERER